MGPNAVAGSDRFGEFVECGRDSQVVSAGVDAEFVVAATQVLNERVTTDHHRRRPVAFESPHRSQPGLEPAMVGLDAVVGVLLGVVECIEQQLVYYPQQRGRQVGGDLGGSAVHI